MGLGVSRHLGRLSTKLSTGFVDRKKELKKRGLSALVDISHEVGWRLGFHPQKFLDGKCCFEEVQDCCVWLFFVICQQEVS